MNRAPHYAATMSQYWRLQATRVAAFLNALAEAFLDMVRR